MTMIYLFLLVIASIGPGLLWLWYFYRQDRYEPEPLRFILKTFFIGLLVVIPAGLLEQIWRQQLITSVKNADWAALLVMSFLVISLVEEGLKTLALWWTIGRSRELNEPADGIIYGITLGLGFASLENLLWASVFGFGVAALRAIVTTLAHASFTGWMGHYISRYKLQNGVAVPVLFKGFLIVFVSHGLYDFLLFLRNPISSLLAFLLVATLLVRLYRLLRKQVEESPFR
jgi:RsiW-degrading membrane proteinase PrsW (M82 family)